MEIGLLYYLFFSLVANSFLAWERADEPRFDKGPNKHELGPQLIQYSTFEGGNALLQLLFWEAFTTNQWKEDVVFTIHI